MTSIDDDRSLKDGEEQNDGDKDTPSKNLGKGVLKTKDTGKECLVIAAKDCKTVAKFYLPSFGTFINEHKNI